MSYRIEGSSRPSRRLGVDYLGRWLNGEQQRGNYQPRLPA